jgi:hypothetical protein
MRMILGIVTAVTLLAVGCRKEPLTLDEKTPMKALLSASDKEITDLVMREIKEKMDISSEDVSIEYILRDKNSQALAVKVKVKDAAWTPNGKLGSQDNPYDWSTPTAQMKNADIPAGSYIKTASGKIRQATAAEIAWAKKEAARNGITP